MLANRGKQSIVFAMKKSLSGWQLFGIFVLLFVVFAVTKLNVVAIVADIVGLVAIATGIQNHVKSHKEPKDLELPKS